MSTQSPSLWVRALGLAGLGVGLGVGLTVGRELGDSWLTRALISGGIGGAVTITWAAVVWLLFVRSRKPGE